ncbi:unnamed protein product, partial [Acidithrix sp. C25]
VGLGHRASSDNLFIIIMIEIIEPGLHEFEIHFQREESI